MMKLKMLAATVFAALLVISMPYSVNAGKHQAEKPAAPLAVNPYEVYLENYEYVNGNFEWTWTVLNPNPGTGNNGSVQDLSHWGLDLGTCFDINDVVTAAYSFDGVSWNYFTPRYERDKSQSAISAAVLKFDVGTKGSAKTYYKLIVSKEYTVGTSTGYFKSGSKTGSGTFPVDGLDCENEGGSNNN